MKTKKVRILVAIDPSGDWSSYGFSWMDSQDAKVEIYIETLKDGVAYHWITAEVPIPEASEIAGVVE